MSNNKREDKQKRQSSPIWSKLLPSIIQVRVPVPFSLKWINSYILLEQQGTFTVIDPGLRTPEAEAVWANVMSELKLEWSSCTAIVVTHQHPDHYGLSGYVQQLSGAPVYMTRDAKAYTEKLWGAGSEQFERDMKQLLHTHGTPDDIAEAILLNLREFQARVEPQPDVTYVEAGEALLAGDRHWQLIHTEGHAYGGIMLYDANEKLLLCGDQVLPRITPHVGVVAGEDRPVLQQFLNHLQQIAELEVSLVLPGHREPFTRYRERIESILQHHERRLAELYSYIAENGAVVAFVCCEWMFGSHLRDQPHNMRFALTEVIAHLQYLQQQGKLLEQPDAAGKLIYSVR